MDGITIDGVNDAHVDNFTYWEMVKGDTGAYLRTIDITHDLLDWAHKPNLPVDNFMMNWYYDNRVPDDPTGGSEGSPIHPNGWHMCSGALTGKVMLYHLDR